LAGAVAQSNVQQLVRDMMTAREYGAQQAARVNANTEIDNATRDAKNAVSNFGALYALGGKQLLLRTLGLIDDDTIDRQWEEINKARAKTREETEKTRRMELMGIKPFDAQGFLNIVPQVPKVPWDEVLNRANNRGNMTATFGIDSFGVSGSW
jgi:hypothetical protein